MATSFLPRDISQLVSEYEEGTFRLKSNKMTIIAHRMAGEIIKDWCEDIGTFDAEPGVWRAVLGPFTYEKERTYIPLILAPSNFDISTLPDISINRDKAPHVISLDNINIMYGDEIVASFNILPFQGDNRVNGMSLINTFSIGGAYILIFRRGGSLEVAAYKAIDNYVRGVALNRVINDIKRKLPGVEVRIPKYNKRGLIIIIPERLRILSFPRLPRNNVYITEQKITPFSQELHYDMSTIDELDGSPIYEDVKEWVRLQNRYAPIDVLSNPAMLALYRKIMSDYEGRGFSHMGNVRFVVDSDNTYHIEEVLDT